MSHWSAPKPGPFSRDQRIMYAMAAAHVRRHFEHLVLVTDSPGASELIADMGLPFDHVTTELDELSPKLSHIWAMGKVKAYGYWPEPFLHIDFDILMERPLPERMLKAACCAERLEGHLMATGESWCKYFPWLPPRWVVAMTHRYAHDYNCGIFGGNDIPRIRQMVADSLKAASYVEDTCREICSCGGTLSRFFEQWPIGRYFREDEIELLTTHERFDPRIAKELGYYHFQGDSKHRQLVKLFFEQRLARIDPALAVRARLRALPEKAEASILEQHAVT